MYRILTFCMLFVIISCFGQQKELSKQTIDSIVIKDTLRDTHHEYYLADKTPREFAELILKDSVTPTDNFSTFRVMDSLEAKSFDDRRFYFKVFLNILKKSDGALAEAVGSPAYTYPEKHTKEFFQLSQTITNEQFELWAYNVGVEIYLSSTVNPTKDAAKYVSKLRGNCLPEQKSAIEKFYKIIRKAIADCEKNESN